MNELTTYQNDINKEHALCLKKGQEMLEHAKNVGELLIKVKEELPHGQFMKWVEDNCDFSQRSSDNYRKIATNWEQLSNSQRTANFDSITQALNYIKEEEYRPLPASVVEENKKKSEQARQALDEFIETRQPKTLTPIEIAESPTPMKGELIDDDPSLSLEDKERIEAESRRIDNLFSFDFSKESAIQTMGKGYALIEQGISFYLKNSEELKKEQHRDSIVMLRSHLDSLETLYKELLATFQSELEREVV